MSLWLLYTGLLCLIIVVVISVVKGYNLLSTQYVQRTLLGTIHTHDAMRILLLHFPFEDLDTKSNLSRII